MPNLKVATGTGNADWLLGLSLGIKPRLCCIWAGLALHKPERDDDCARSRLIVFVDVGCKPQGRVLNRSWIDTLPTIETCTAAALSLQILATLTQTLLRAAKDNDGLVTPKMSLKLGQKIFFHNNYGCAFTTLKENMSKALTAMQLNIICLWGI